jgi:zinc/manganese transport system permease protein
MTLLPFRRRPIGRAACRICNRAETVVVFSPSTAAISETLRSFSFYTTFAGQATILLFGNVLGVRRSTLWTMLAMGALALSALAVIARPLTFASLPPELAEARGMSPRLLGTIFMVLVALVVAESVQVVGILLVFSLMVAPPATAL